jgi:flagellar motor switch protein FliN
VSSMTMSLERLQDALAACAETAARTLPADHGLAAGAPPSGGQPPESLIPGSDARAVSATLAGDLGGTLLLLVSAALADSVERGPLGDQHLVDAVGPTLDDTVMALSRSLGLVLRLDGPQEIEPGIAFGAAAGGFAGVPLLDGQRHVASLAILLDAPARDGTTAPPADAGAEPVADARTHTFEPLAPAAAEPASRRSMDLLRDVEMGVTAELGRTRMTVRQLLGLVPGSVVDLDRSAGSPVDVLVNGTLIARGEVVVVDEEFGIRISEIVGQNPDEPRSQR